MIAITEQRPTRDCPACGESILVVARKCKHCGERFDQATHETPSVIPTKQPTEDKSSKYQKIKKGIIVGVALLIVMMSFGFAWRSVPNTETWVRLHSDIMWHREWQDLHVEQDRMRVIEIYTKMRDGHAGEGNYDYLAARALPSGQESLTAFQQASQKHQNNPWIFWGLANAWEESGKDVVAIVARQRAIELFGDKVPGFAISGYLFSCAKLSQWQEIQKVHDKFISQINNSGELAATMSLVEWMRGDYEGSVGWEERANKLGYPTENKYKHLIMISKALNMRPDIIGATAEPIVIFQKFPPNFLPSLRVVDYFAKEEENSYFLKFELQYGIGRVYQSEGSYFRDDIVLLTHSDAELHPWKGSTATTDVKLDQPAKIVATFNVSKGEQVKELILRTGRFTQKPVTIEMTIRVPEGGSKAGPIQGIMPRR